MQIIARLVHRYPRLIIAAVVALTLVFAYAAQSVTVTTDIKDFFPSDHPKVITYEEIEDKFGGAEYIMVAMTAPDVFAQDTLLRIKGMTQQLEAVDGVSRVRSLTNVDEIKGTDWGVEVAPLMEDIPSDPDSLKKLRARVLADDMYAGTIVSLDGEAALMIVEVEPGADPVLVAGRVQNVVDQFQGPEALYVTGTPVLNAVLADAMKADLAKLLPIVLLLVAVVLYLYFHSLRGVLLPFVTVIISVIWTLGLMGLLGKQISPLNSVMPVILVSLGNAYGIYVLARYNDELSWGADKKRAVTNTLLSVGLAVLMAGTTTVAGFASNVTSSITQMRDFGLFTGYGVLVALGISLTFIPAVLEVLPPAKRKHAGRDVGGGKNLLERGLDRLASVVVRRSNRVLAVALLVAVTAALGVPRVSTDSNFFSFFDPETQPRIAYDLVRDKFSGSESIEIVVKGDVLAPNVLKAMKGFQDDLEQTGLVGKPQSIVNVLERTNQALNEGDPRYAELPDSRELVAQYLLLLEMSDDSFLNRLLTLNYTEARIQALVRDSSPAGTEALFAHVDRLLSKHFSSQDVEVTQTGIIVLMDTLAEMIIQGQILSLLFSLGAVFLIVRLLLRSWEGSSLSVLLILLATVVNFGLMGWAGIALDIVTVLISSIGIGVGIDYSIHIYSRFQEEKRAGKSDSEAVAAAVTTTGKAITCNAAAVIAGFLILVLSSFPPLRYFGLLVTVIMFVAAAGSLTVVPAFIQVRSRWRAVRQQQTSKA